MYKKPSGTASYSITIQGSVFGGNDKDQIRTTVSFDPRWVTENDNTEYNKDLAAFAAVISDDVYFRTKDADNGVPQSRSV